MKECQITRGFSMKRCLKGPIRRIGTIGIYILLHLLGQIGHPYRYILRGILTIYILLHFPGHIEYLHFVTLAVADLASMAEIYKIY